jgi:hypothetical protein
VDKNVQLKVGVFSDAFKKPKESMSGGARGFGAVRQWSAGEFRRNVLGLPTEQEFELVLVRESVGSAPVSSKQMCANELLQSFSSQNSSLYSLTIGRFCVKQVVKRLIRWILFHNLFYLLFRPTCR